MFSRLIRDGALAAALLYCLPATLYGVDANEVRSATGIERGLALVVADDAQLAADLADEGKMIVHLLTPDRKRVHPLRTEIQRRGLGGRVIVDALSPDGQLSHPDRLVNLLVLDEDGQDLAPLPSPKERVRVLSTLGRIYQRKSGKWNVNLPLADEGLGDWTHRWFDASGNCVSDDRIAAFPRAVQWQHGPAMEDGTADGKLPRIADGRWLNIDTASGDLVCRDAGNGMLLWRQPYAQSTRDELAVVADRIYFYYDAAAKPSARSREKPTAGPLVAANLASGEIVQTFDEGLRSGAAKRIAYDDPDESRRREETPVPWFIASREVIVQAYDEELVVLDRQSGKRRFAKRLEGATWFSPVIAGQRLIAAEAAWPARRGRHDGSGNVRAVSAFALNDGVPLWRNEDVHPEREIADKQRRYLSRAEFKPMSTAGDLLLLHVSSYQFRQGGSIAVLNVGDGRQLWRQSYQPKQRYDQGSQRAVLRAGEVVLMDGMGALRYDARTGKSLGEETRLPKGAQRMARANGACTSSRATQDWLICNAYLYVGPDGQPQPQFGARGACGQGVIPAHGLIFVPPTPCDCGDYLRGHAALAPQIAGKEVRDEERLFQGRAYGEVALPAPRDAPPAWPTFLGDPQRRSASAAKLPANITPLLRVPVAKLRRDDLDADRRDSERHLGALSAPVTNGEIVLVAAPERHEVIALDAASGETRWRYPAGGKVDTPPTLAGGLAVFGCDDGHVYALRASDGELAWRFQAAPQTAISLHHGHLASAFPLPGSVLVLGDAVVAVAGHHTDLGGLHAWVLDLATGRPRAHRVIAADQPRVVANDIAVADADERGFWIGQQLHLSLTLADLPAQMRGGPKPPVALDRSGTRMRFRTDFGRGGSTHPWKGAMTIPGSNSLARGHRLAIADAMTYVLLDPTAGRPQTPLVWSARTAADASSAAWRLTGEQMDSPQSLSAMVLAGDYLFVGGGARDGTRGQLHVIESASGKLLATHDLAARVTECGLAVAGQRLYVACEDGALVCFGQQ